MAQFEQDKAYAPQEETFVSSPAQQSRPELTQLQFDDGREEELVEFVINHPDAASMRGSPSRVLRAIDEFGRTKKYLMNVGEDKGKIVTDLIRETKPRIMIELGGYCGYSTILFGAVAREAGGEKYYSLERSSKFAKNIETLVELAGLKDFVEVLVGPSNEGIKKLHSRGLEMIDMMFLDHYKPAYTSDLKLCEHLGLIMKGTVLAADNVIAPGNPPYLEYVRSSVEEKRVRVNQEAKADTDSFGARHAAQYGKVEELSTEAKGNPNIVYESKLVHSFEPTGVPVSFKLTLNPSLC
jgi:catechol O-methyltransferase